jgi:hypothetical protein
MKNLIKILVASIIILSIFSACDKYHIDRYVGDWEFMTIIKQTKNIDNDTAISIGCDTIYYLGKISSLNSENELIVHFTENENIKLTLDVDKNLWSDITPYSTCAQCPAGYFKNVDKIILNFYKVTFDKEDRVYHTYYIDGRKIERR